MPGSGLVISDHPSVVGDVGFVVDPEAPALLDRPAGDVDLHGGDPGRKQETERAAGVQGLSDRIRHDAADVDDPLIAGDVQHPVIGRRRKEPLGDERDVAVGRERGATCHLEIVCGEPMIASSKGAEAEPEDDSQRPAPEVEAAKVDVDVKAFFRVLEVAEVAHVAAHADAVVELADDAAAEVHAEAVVVDVEDVADAGGAGTDQADPAVA